MKPAPGKVVVLIISHKKVLEWYEEISLRQCVRVLGGHPIRLVCPEGLDVSAYRALAPAVEVDFIPPGWLSSYANFERLKISPFLYRRYSQYEFVLFYELDAFVFRDDLQKWCDAGWDYLGAPWFEGYNLAGPDARPFGAGNGGFSLRRTHSLLRASRTFRYRTPLAKLWQARFAGRGTYLGALADMTIRNNFFTLFNNYRGAEDAYWCHYVGGRFPWFRVAPFEVAKYFSFEVNPRRLFSECDNVLPFGCHKWMVYDLPFWRNHIAACGYEVPVSAARP